MKTSDSYTQTLAIMMIGLLIISFHIKHLAHGFTHSHPEDKDQQPVDTLIVMVSVGNVHSRPATTSSIIGKLKKEDRVTFITKRDEWYIVILEDDRVGWAHQSLFLKSDENKPDGKTASKEIKEIRFEMTPEGEEKVIFLLSGYYPPHTFTKKGGKPRVVCDFYDIRLARGVQRHIPVNGSIIQRIRIGFHRGPEPKLRVVLDLVPHQEHYYKIQPMFFKKENLYILILSKTQELETR
ncbi:MAG: SH3 domain-containing protein [Deltaproteobacteria bacterium]|nr:SH3 domain-containing protein [Deltaproteobacteria bacterium]MBW1912585.1 SH3 domain-containing protein [Deltaproteobacteria bacterium]